MFMFMALKYMCYCPGDSSGCPFPISDWLPLLELQMGKGGGLCPAKEF